MAGKRKPYIREPGAAWWLKQPHYRFYMLREGTSLFALWVSLLLLAALFAPAAFSRLLGNPLVMALNAIALLAALLHSLTWFRLTPKALNLPEEKLRRLPRLLLGAAAACNLLLLVLYFV